MAIRLIGLLTLCVSLTHCKSRPEPEVRWDDASYGLSDEPTADGSDSDDFYADRAKADNALELRSSLPLQVKIAKASDKFAKVPPEATTSPPSQVIIQDGTCSMRLTTGMVEAGQFLWAGKWVKLADYLPPNVPLKLDIGQDLYLKISTPIRVEVDPKFGPLCAQKYKGKKVYLGRYHIHRSFIGFIADPQSPPMRFTGRSRIDDGRKVYMQWGRNEAAPLVIDDLDFPVILESAIYHAKFDKPGVYYVKIKPRLMKIKAAQKKPGTPVPTGDGVLPQGPVPSDDSGAFDGPPSRPAATPE